MNPFVEVKDYLFGILKALGGQLKADTIAFLKQFVRDDVGAIVTGVILSVNAQMPGATGADKKAAATEQLLAALSKSGKDAASFATSELNFLLESGLQAVKAGLAK